MSTTDTAATADAVIPGPADGASDLERACWAAIDEIEDPHMPVSLVELGMIYDVAVEGGEATVDLTFPCMGCPAYDMVLEDLETSLLAFDGVDEVTIDIVWDPVWSKDMLTPEVRAKLNDWGLAL